MKNVKFKIVLCFYMDCTNLESTGLSFYSMQLMQIELQAT